MVVSAMMKEDFIINLLCAELAEETLNDYIEFFCDDMEARLLEAANPRYHGPDYDEGCEFDPVLG